MLVENRVIIRKFSLKDRTAVREICCQTALMGEPSSIFFDDDEIFADALTQYFTDYEPESCFVAEKNDDVIGYIIGAKDTKAMGKVFNAKILFGLLVKAIMRGTLFRIKNVRFFFHIISSLIKGEFNEPDFSKDYPAVLHINIKDGFRASGVGSMLISTYMKYLTEEKVAGVHLATMSEGATIFFVKQGMELLHSTRRSYLRYILKRDITVNIIGRRINLS